MAPAAPTHDYYITLEVSSNTRHEDIRTSYRRLARQNHPDKNNGSREATVKTQQINEAWEVLSDPVKRAKYDKTRFRTSNSTANHSKPPKHNRKAQPHQHPTQSNPSKQQDARAEAEIRENRQQSLKFEMQQGQSIRHCQNQIKPLETEITALNDEILVMEARVLLYPAGLSDTERDDLKLRLLNTKAVLRIKQSQLNTHQSRLQELLLDLMQRRANGQTKPKDEQERNTRSETGQRPDAQQEATKKEERNPSPKEQAEEQHLFQEVMQSYRYKLAKDKADSDARLRAQAAAAAAAATEQENKPTESTTTKPSTPPLDPHFEPCLHQYWWKKLPGPQTCNYCTKPLFRFFEQCLGCQTRACVSCKIELVSCGFRWIPSRGGAGGAGGGGFSGGYVPPSLRNKSTNTATSTTTSTGKSDGWRKGWGKSGERSESPDGLWAFDDI